MNIMQTPPPEDPEQVQRATRKIKVINWLHALFYFACSLAGMLAANEIVHWKQAHPMLLAGTLAAIVSLSFLVYWIWMDRREDVLECPPWLRLIIVLTGWLSLVLLVLGTVLQYTRA